MFVTTPPPSLITKNFAPLPFPDDVVCKFLWYAVPIPDSGIAEVIPTERTLPPI